MDVSVPTLVKKLVRLLNEEPRPPGGVSVAQASRSGRRRPLAEPAARQEGVSTQGADNHASVLSVGWPRPSA